MAIRLNPENRDPLNDCPCFLWKALKSCNSFVQVIHSLPPYLIYADNHCPCCMGVTFFFQRLL